MNKRVKIMEFLINNKNHPTADMIYSALVCEIEGLSKTTIYNTLNLFVQEGVAKSLNIDSTELRYDPDMTQHGHFKCKECGGIYDFSFNHEFISDVRLDKFRIEDYQFSIWGICPFCLKGKHS